MKFLKIFENMFQNNKPIFPENLNAGDMVNLIVESNLQTKSGIIDLEDAQFIAYAADEWVLTEIELEHFNFDLDNNYLSESKLPPLILDMGDGEYDVMDGKQRIARAKKEGKDSLLVYLGEV